MTTETQAPAAGKLIESMERVIVGKRDVIELVVAGLLAGGHILVEDVPGVGKTTLAKSLAKSLGCSFKRIQFTPDLLPADIIGVSVFSQATTEFEFRPGPVFANIVLADEVNRTTPKTQSALLECMEEKQITVDGVTHVLEQPFFVIATENPIEYEGTYRLPEAQLDRFLLRVSIGYPSSADELAILNDQERRHPLETIEPVMERDEVLELQSQIKEVFVEDSIKEYIVALAGGTRERPDVFLGASPRGSLTLRRCGQALAAVQGRGYVLPDDVKRVAVPALAHRLVVQPEARARGTTAESVVEELLRSVPVPVVEREE
ncbi:MAG: MoxR family ATPase [Armatimonadota bacterium]|jgi:MoxR-like ATPase